MKTLLCNLLFVYTFLNFSFAQDLSKLQTGDVILQPLSCWSCTLIEREENTIFSHVGLIFKDPRNNQLWVFEANDTVQRVRFEKFIAKNERGQLAKVIRLKEINNWSPYVKKAFSINFERDFIENFEGLQYDKQFLWDNTDEDGNEKYYCSELVAKLLNHFIENKIVGKKMHFNYNRELWERYFNGPPPHGKWGIAPADLERSHLFFEVTHI
ncbi:MAG: YiiX/YebB-like N1pC/P60 family cysteine hydrolase [Bacteriovoracia bacterium]